MFGLRTFYKVAYPGASAYNRNGSFGEKEPA